MLDLVAGLKDHGGINSWTVHTEYICLCMYTCSCHTLWMWARSRRRWLKREFWGNTQVQIINNNAHRENKWDVLTKCVIKNNLVPSWGHYGNISTEISAAQSVTSNKAVTVFCIPKWVMDRLAFTLKESTHTFFAHACQRELYFKRH